ncbi:PQQ-binding-like beta-propeller repeat protein [Streptomyces sp. SID8379]|uniref:outer membrane protein assembly factor BamB family protein n=1 Tax=unclassified Streptomyces TaxID=2593676 RepID=UPI00037E4795|nr:MULTISPECIES: PQQ-binding-like beta-propeller repeat protein [unclassified Streptomyces]MYW63482.1 PQQ-binding-like beta-propeller repeat protein [Streptomyces sp. SID8379]
MTDPSSLSRRRLLQAGGAFGLAAAAESLVAAPAHAETAERPTTVVTDLGPGLVQFSLMSGLLVGDTVYIGSRNLNPPSVIGFHLPSRKVVSTTTFDAGPEPSIQALAADPEGRYLYVGFLVKSDQGRPNLFRWDLRTPEKPAVAIGRTEDRDIRDLAVAPDGAVFAVGGAPGKAPVLWEYDPATGAVTDRGTPDPNATLARAVAATDTTVFFGAGSVLAGGGSASKASLFAFDRATHTFTSVVPKEMEKDPSLRELAVMDGQLVVGTSGGVDPAKFAVMDLDDLSSYTVVPTEGTTVKSFAADADHIYFASDTGMNAYSKADRTVSPLEFDGPDLGEIWGVDQVEGKLAVVSAYGFVAEIDLSAGTSVVTDLHDAGANAGAQAGMGIAAGGGYVYLGGNGAISRRSLRTGEVVNLRAPGEAKDAEVIEGRLYTGQYNAQGIWRYDPSRGAGPSQIARFPSAQNRPLDTSWDPESELLLVGVQSDTEGGGALWTYSPRTGKAASYVNPIDDVQLVRAVANRDGVAYLGGDNASKVGPRATVVALDPVTGEEKWRVDPKQDAGVAALAVQGRSLYALTTKGTLFVVDLRSRKVVHTADVSSVSKGFAAMVVNRGVVYGVSDTTLFRFHPRTFAVSTVVAGINGAWYSGPHVNAHGGRLYTLRDHNLVEVEDRPWR